MGRDKRFARRTVCTLAVFAAAFLFYLLTAAYVPYPGASSTYLASLVFPWQYAVPRGDLVGSLLVHLLSQAVPPASLMTAVSVLTSFCGAVAVTALFRLVYFTVHLSSIDMEGVREEEMSRTTGDIAFCAEITGLAAAAAGAVSVPLWAISTRPQPATLSVAGIALLWALTAELRYRHSLLVRSRATRLGAGEMLLVTVTAFLSFVTVLSDVCLLPPVLLSLLIVFMPLFMPDMLFRMRTLPCLIIGMVLAFAVSVGVMELWQGVFAGETAGSALAQWAVYQSDGIAVLLQTLQQPTEAIALALLALSAALMLGCLPMAYCCPGRPLSGQIAAVSIPVVAVLGWPDVFWGALQEPSALSVMAVVLSVAAVGSVAGSWCRCWLDRHMDRRPSSAYGIGGLLVVLPMLLMTVSLVWIGWRSGAGFPARRAFADGWDAYEAAVGKESKLWLSDTSRSSDAYILRRYAAGNPIAVAPIRLLLGDRFEGFGGRAFADELRDDAVMAELCALGEPSVRMYLEEGATYAGFLADADRSEQAAEALVGLADRLGETDYGRTPAGQVSMRKAREWAARCYASLALTVTPADSLRLLRRAAALDPRNRAYPLGVEAAAQAASIPLTPEERHAALCIREADPWLNAPTWWQMEQFDAAEGRVRVPAFDSARRLRAVRRGGREAAIAVMTELYRTAPESVNAVERAVVLLELPEDEAGALLMEQEAPLPTDVQLYLAAYPFTEMSHRLAARYPEFVKQDEALARCYDPSNIRHMSLTRMADMASAYFAQKATNVRAVLYVSLCLKDGDVDRAKRFVSGFLLEERLPRTAYLAEQLRLTVLRRLADAPGHGRAAAEAWLRSQPYQAALWTYLLTEIPLDDTERRKAAQACLAVFPAHPEASRLEAEHIRRQHGDEAADRYLNAVRNAASFGKEM